MLEYWKLYGRQPCVVKGPATRYNHGVTPVVMEKDSRQLAGGVNVVVNEPTDILDLLLWGKLVTRRLREWLRHGLS